MRIQLFLDPLNFSLSTPVCILLGISIRLCLLDSFMNVEMGLEIFYPLSQLIEFCFLFCLSISPLAMITTKFFIDVSRSHSLESN